MDNVRYVTGLHWPTSFLRNTVGEENQKVLSEPLLPFSFTKQYSSMYQWQTTTTVLRVKNWNGEADQSIFSPAKNLPLLLGQNAKTSQEEGVWEQHDWLPGCK